MAERPSRPLVDRVPGGHEAEIDTEVAPPTRVADYIDGGEAHFSVDRDVAEQFSASVPGGMARFRAVARESQAFLERAVHHLAADAGVRQFLVTGWKLTGEPNVHELAQAIAPAARVVYVVVDPVLLAHAHDLQPSTDDGATAYVHVKLRDPDEILRRAATTLDLAEPVAVLLPATLAFARRDDTASWIVSRLMAGVAPGSHLVITHHASDLFVEEHVEMYRCIDRLAAEGKTWNVTPRSHAAVAKFFDGLDLVDPGLVPQDEWRATPPPDLRGAIYAAIARKP